MRTRILAAVLSFAATVATLAAEPVTNPAPKENFSPKPASKPETELDPELKAKLEELAKELNETIGKSEPVSVRMSSVTHTSNKSA